MEPIRADAYRFWLCVSHFLQLTGAFWPGIINKFGKFLDWCTGWRQNLWNAVGGRPTRLTFLGPTFAFVKCGRVQTTAPRKAGTWHSVFHCESLYGAPNIIMCHYFPLFLLHFIFYYAGAWGFNKHDFLGIPGLSQDFYKNFKYPKNYFDKNTWQTVLIVLYFDSSERQQSLTEHENVRGAQRFQTPSYILSPLDSGPQQSLECPFLFLLSFLSGHSKNTAGNGGISLFFKHNCEFPMVAADELVECGGFCDFISGIG